MNRVENEKKCNMKMMQYQKKIKSSTRKTVHWENSAMRKNCNMKRVQGEKLQREKSATLESEKRNE